MMDVITIVPIVLIVIVGAHILEEAFASFKLSNSGKRVQGLRRFFNLEWFQTGDEEFPVTQRTALVKDQILLFVVLTLLVLLSERWPILIWVVVGFIIADLIQHGVFSIVKRKYSPGVTTSVLYLIFVIYFLGFGSGDIDIIWELGAMVIGAVLLVGNYVIAAWKVRGRKR